MLRIIQNCNAVSAERYYSQSDYYSDGQELVGHWGGKAAELLGLNGEVGREDFHSLCQNRDPSTGEPLTARTRTDRTVGYDFNFHAPKSVSIVYALTQDERILAAFRSSVDEAMQLLERDAKTRVRKNGEMSERTTGNLAWAEFIHFTARPVNGEPDPHLHAHCFTNNCTFDSEENIWKAVQFRDIKRDARYYEAAFHASFASRLRELGYGISNKVKAWEITGIDPRMIREFSRRTALIDELARSKGIVDPVQKDALGSKTREAKAKALSTEELREAWSKRLTPDELNRVQQVYSASRREVAREPTVSSKHALSYAIAHEFERQSVVPTRKILETALRYGAGDVRLSDVECEIPDSGLIVRDWDGRSHATTKEVLAEERRMLNFARDGRATRAPLNAAWSIEREWLNTGQQGAVQQLLHSQDRIMILKGKAGTGKTSLMQEAVAGIEAGNHQVLALAPSNEASRGVLRSEGFATADTVARFLVDTKLQESAKGQVVWIDEAGLLSSKDMASVFDVAQRLNFRIILSGDWGQHGSVERGSALRLLATDAGIKPAEVRSIQRQRGEYRSAIEHLAAGRTLEGFNALDNLGWVEELSNDEREKRVAREYLSSLTRNEELLVVCPTHAEGERCTNSIRKLLQAEGLLGREELRFVKLEPKHFTQAERTDPFNYESGDVLVMMQNSKQYKKGTRLAYTPALDAQLPELAPRIQVYHPSQMTLSIGDKIRLTAGGTSADGHRLNNGAIYRIAGFSKSGQPILNNGWKLAADWGLWARAFTSTSHASQGKSVARVILCQSAISQGAASQEQFYVSASRGKQSCLILCDSKSQIRDQISHSESKLTATEFIRRDHRRPRLRFVQRLIHHAATLKNYLFDPSPHRDRNIHHAR